MAGEKSCYYHLEVSFPEDWSVSTEKILLVSYLKDPELAASI
jgi:hypothetical protein